MIVFQYFRGCPGAAATLNNLRQAAAGLGIPLSKIETVEVPDPSFAEERCFQGSPTILLDGRDLVTAARPRGYNFTCRIYGFEGQDPGVIPEEFIRERLKGHSEA